MFRDQVKFPFERRMVQCILAGVMILVLSCVKSERPEGILTEQQMVSIMTELYLAEEKANKLPIPSDSIKEIFPLFSARAFKKANVSDTVFKKSMDYYMGQPEKLENIYTTLVDSLNLKAERASAHKKDASPD